MNDKEWVRIYARNSNFQIWSGLILLPLMAFLIWKALGTGSLLFWISFMIILDSVVMSYSVAVLSREVIDLQHRIKELEGRIP